MAAWTLLFLLLNSNHSTGEMRDFNYKFSPSILFILCQAHKNLTIAHSTIHIYSRINRI